MIISSVIMLGAALPYIRGILAGKTKPNIVSWITWTLLTGTATIAELTAHEYIAAIFTAAITLQTATIVVLGLWRGFVKYESFDVLCQIGAIIGIVLWQIFDSPTIGVVSSVIIDLLGALPTVRHAWLKPYEENWPSFALTGVGGVLALGALSTYNWVSLPYPIYILLMDTLIAVVILQRGRVIHAPK